MKLILLTYSEKVPAKKRASWWDSETNTIGLARSRLAGITLAHELGHKALGHEGAVLWEFLGGCNLEKELQAWAWALRRHKTNRVERSFIRWALRGYECQCVHPKVRGLSRRLRGALGG